MPAALYSQTSIYLCRLTLTDTGKESYSRGVSDIADFESQRSGRDFLVALLG